VNIEKTLNIFLRYNLMKRKIIRQGHNTLTITLPSNWTKKFNLSPGKEVSLFEKGGGLFVTTEKFNEKKRAEFNIAGMDIPTIWKYFMAVYREGYDEVLVKFNPKEKLENPYKFFTTHKLDLRYRKQSEKKNVLGALQGFVDRFIGFEIVEHGKDFILVREMGELTGKQFENSLRRIFLLIQQMNEETLKAIQKNNPDNLISIHDVDVNLDKFHDYCIRILNRTGNQEVRKSGLLFSTLWLLEMVGDEFKNISFHLLRDFPKEKLKSIEKLALAINRTFNIYYELFYNFDLAKIAEISEIDKEIYLAAAPMYKKASEEEKEIFHHLRMIGKYLNALSELRIEMEF
jgi:phosphate uptake regulator